MSSKFTQFCTKHYKTLQFFETTFIILVFLLLAFLVYNKYFLEYKVVLVEKDIKGNYHVVKEIIRNGKVTDPIFDINVSQPESDYIGKIIIDTQKQVDAFEYEQYLYNIS